MHSIKYRFKPYLFEVCVNINWHFPVVCMDILAYTHSKTQIKNSISKM